MLGNIIGGAVLVSICYRVFIYVRNPKNQPGETVRRAEIILALFAHRARHESRL